MDLTVRLILIVTIIDVTGYLLIKKHPEYLTIPFVVVMIVVTVIPIGMSSMA